MEKDKNLKEAISLLSGLIAKIRESRSTLDGTPYCPICGEAFEHGQWMKTGYHRPSCDYLKAVNFIRAVKSGQ